MPEGVKADLLGIELGMPYAEAKAALAALSREALSADPMREKRTSVSLGGSTEASYISEISLNRHLRGSTRQTIDEVITIKFSAPPSGQQTPSVNR
jgi:hypothetical protein